MLLRRRISLMILIATFLMLEGVALSKGLTATERFALSDQARGLHATGLRVDFFVESFEGKVSHGRQRYTLRTRDANALAELHDEAGKVLQIVLVLGDDFWLIKPTSTRPTRISTQERATGIASIGDIMATNFSLGYTLVRERSEKYKGKRAVVGTFSPKGMLAAYQEVEAWLDLSTNLVVRATYGIDKGKVEKIIEYEYANVLGQEKKKFISKMNVKPTKQGGPEVIVDFSPPVEEPLDSDWFKVESVLKRLKSNQ